MRSESPREPLSEPAGEPGAAVAPSNQLDPELLDLLRCPLTRSRLRQEGDLLVAEVGGLAYPVRDGIPVMLIEEARLPAGVSSLDELKGQLRDQIPA